MISTSNEFVTLRRTTFDDALQLLELVSQLHTCEPENYLKTDECDACNATRVTVEMREQANQAIKS